MQENSGAFSPTNSPAIPLDADLTVQREAPGGLAEDTLANDEKPPLIRGARGDLKHPSRFR